MDERSETDDAGRAAKETTPDSAEVAALVEERTSALRAANEQLQQEIAERRKIEQLLREREVSLRSLHEHLPVALFVVEVMEDGQFRYAAVNAMHEQLTGLTTEAVAGRTPLELVPEVPPAAAAAVLANYQRCVQAGQIIEYEEMVPFRGRDAWWLTRLAPLRNEKGRIRRIIGTSLRIDERKQAEATLQRYHVLAESSRDIILFVRQADGRILEANRAAVEAYGYSHEELLGLSIYQIRDPAPRSLVTEQMGQAGAAGVRFEAVHRRKDGSGFPVEVVSQGAIIAGEQVLLSVVRDITERRRAEAELRQSESLLSETQKLAHLGSYQFEVPEGQVRWSEETFRITGRDPRLGEPSIDEYMQIVHPEDRGLVQEEVAAAVAAGAPFAFDYRVVKPDGAVVHVHSAGQAVRDGQRIVRRVVGSLLDTTQQKQAEARLRESERRFKLLFEQAPLAYQSMNAEGRLLDVNRAWLAALGYERDEVIGRPMVDFLYPTHAALFSERFARFKAAGQMNSVEYALRRKDGTRFLACFDGTMGRDERGRFQQTHCIFRDITEQRRAEEALRESEQRQRAILDHAPMAVFLKDLAGRYTFVNRQVERWMGMGREGMLGRTDHELFPSPVADLFAAHDRRLREAGGPIELEYQMMRPDGPHTYLSVRFPLRDERGTVYGFCAFTSDITDRRQAEMELRSLTGLARCLLWHADIHMPEDPIARPVWVTHVVDGDGAQQVLPLEVPARQTYVEAMLASHLDGECARKDATSDAAIRGGRSFYSQEFRCRDLFGQIRWIHEDVRLINVAPGRWKAVGVCTNVTDRKQAEEEQQTTIRWLELITSSTNDGEKLLRSAARLLKERLGCDAVGVRLREGEDFPYRAVEGFTPQFVHLENGLCALDRSGQVRRNAQGQCMYECVCGAVVSGQTDLDKPFFTPYGSFWTADAHDLLAREPALAGQVRGRCAEAGYRSIAVIPLRAGTECLGLLQVNDRRTGFLTRRRIAHLEQLAQSLSLAMAQLRAQEALRASEQLAATGRMAAQIAHEVNNPLAGIKNAFLLIKDAVPATHPYYRYVGRIEGEIDRIAWIVRQMFHLHRREPQTTAEFRVDDVIRDVTALMNASQSRGVRLEVDLPQFPVTIVAPESSVRQVLFNLLQNAIDASPDNAKVTVGVVAQEPLAIWVADEGCGIPPTVGQRIYEPFFTTKTGPGRAGLGLGLSVSRGLAAAMGGSLEYVSQPGHTVFRLTLPGALRRKELGHDHPGTNLGGG